MGKEYDAKIKATNAMGDTLRRIHAHADLSEMDRIILAISDAQQHGLIKLSSIAREQLVANIFMALHAGGK